MSKLRLLLSHGDNEKGNQVKSTFAGLALAKGFEIVEENPDFVVSIGGDGTMLRTIREYKHLHVPYIGINAGRLGFLPTFKSDRDSLESLLDLIKESDYSVMMRPLLEVEITDVDGEVTSNFAFNEVFTKYANIKMLEADIYIDEVHFNHYTGDGFVVSTPLGATGYAIWSGAAVLKPSTPCYQLTPINPNNSSIHNPLLYSMIIPENERLRFQIRNNDGNSIAISCDGNTVITKNITSIKVGISRERIAVVESRYYDYWAIFKSKILYKTDPEHR
ncbi:MAG: NAD(+)/NADH kinase [Bacillota bacterium]|nr:NAD(+)/NADH kinase [Bacillota bacterium]